MSPYVPLWRRCRSSFSMAWRAGRGRAGQGRESREGQGRAGKGRGGEAGGRGRERELRAYKYM